MHASNHGGRQTSPETITIFQRSTTMSGSQNLLILENIIFWGSLEIY